MCVLLLGLCFKLCSSLSAKIHPCSTRVLLEFPNADRKLSRVEDRPIPRQVTTHGPRRLAYPALCPRGGDLATVGGFRFRITFFSPLYDDA
ncbi:uncharacterized protein BO95DRAFT_235511 [Aspergillus brunneoviolaceus CBS 621.78]|uniref:Uncharacterized protein n=1 Tax=Aspergillus brunneoviolaceus CBS 621.78 TaxID=1450534 RepID=A0ACD1FZM1_9EURO|nr:hypothetical protein BO95DRAFT_235511 [Aspergillus brunneoviolaceus CBS 621.78]RAH42425.1 hypothetical protein BO95DRAFT_235511 [Aspergillus brunneoviolaceus CBS 621.78]